MTISQSNTIIVGVLALQGAFVEHVTHLRKAAEKIISDGDCLYQFEVIEVRTAEQLQRANALVIPGGESTTMSLIAERTGLLQPLRTFVKGDRKPVWGTCAGMILLAEEATRTRKGGQELIGGLDVRVIRNHFGRQADSFATKLDLPFLDEKGQGPDQSFECVFIRAPVVDCVISNVQAEGNQIDASNIIAPSIKPVDASYDIQPVEILASLPPNQEKAHGKETIVAVEQGNVFGTSFHPELTSDFRIHEWWLKNRVVPLVSARI